MTATTTTKPYTVNISHLNAKGETNDLASLQKPTRAAAEKAGRSYIRDNFGASIRDAEVSRDIEAAITTVHFPNTLEVQTKGSVSDILKMAKDHQDIDLLIKEWSRDDLLVAAEFRGLQFSRTATKKTLATALIELPS